LTPFALENNLLFPFWKSTRKSSEEILLHFCGQIKNRKYKNHPLSKPLALHKRWKYNPGLPDGIFFSQKLFQFG
jgi:hypothetical protein